jgi:hypothetical protein
MTPFDQYFDKLEESVRQLRVACAANGSWMPDKVWYEFDVINGRGFVLRFVINGSTREIVVEAPTTNTDGNSAEPAVTNTATKPVDHPAVIWLSDGGADL